MTASPYFSKEGSLDGRFTETQFVIYRCEQLQNIFPFADLYPYSPLTAGRNHGVQRHNFSDMFFKPQSFYSCISKNNAIQTFGAHFFETCFNIASYRYYLDGLVLMEYLCFSSETARSYPGA